MRILILSHTLTDTHLDQIMNQMETTKYVESPISLRGDVFDDFSKKIFVAHMNG